MSPGLLFDWFEDLRRRDRRPNELRAGATASDRNGAVPKWVDSRAFWAKRSRMSRRSHGADSIHADQARGLRDGEAATAERQGTGAVLRLIEAANEAMVAATMPARACRSCRDTSRRRALRRIWRQREGMALGSRLAAGITALVTDLLRTVIERRSNIEVITYGAATDCRQCDCSMEDRSQRGHHARPNALRNRIAKQVESMDVVDELPTIVQARLDSYWPRCAPTRCPKTSASD